MNSNFTSNYVSGNGGALYLFGSNVTMQSNSIKNNIATGSTNFGGGIYSFGSKIDFSQNVVEDNYATANGGGIYGYSPDTSSETFSGNEFRRNVALGSGGGLYYYSTSLNVASTLFEYNQASSGGGMYLYASNNGPQVLNVISRHNLALSGSGGGLVMEVFLGNSAALIKDSILYNNTAETDGGGLFFNGFSGAASVIMTNISVSENLSKKGNGGGIYIFDTSPIITYSQITNNSALADSSTGRGDGGGLWISALHTGSQTPTFNFTTINQNKCSRDGGGLYLTSLTFLGSVVSGSYFSDNVASRSVGGLYIVSANSKNNVTILSSTFVSNLSPNGDCGALKIKTFSSFIAHSSFSGNNALNSAGGVYLEVPTATATTTTATTSSTTSSSKLINSYSYIRNSTFNQNTAQLRKGGALVSLNVDLVVDSSIFRGNIAESGGAIYLSYSGVGGGFISRQKCTIYNNLFSSNSAVTSGGALLSQSSDTQTDLNFNSALDYYTNKALLSSSSSSSSTFQCDKFPLIYINNSSFTQNSVSKGPSSSRGGSISIHHSYLNIQSSTLNSNYVEGKNDDSGGSLYSSSSCIDISKSNFYNNLVKGFSYGNSHGGAIDIDNSILSIDQSTLVNNSAASYDTSHSNGGAVSLSLSSVLIQNTIMQGNSVIQGDGGSISLYTSSNLFLLNVSISESKAMDGYGGALSADSSEGTISLSIFNNNSALNGGVVYLNNAFLSVTKSSMISNKATLNAGVAYINSRGWNVNQTVIQNNAADYFGIVYLSNNVIDNRISIDTSLIKNVPTYGDETYPLYSIAFGSGITDAVSGIQNIINVLAKDNLNKTRPVGGDSITAIFTLLVNGTESDEVITIKNVVGSTTTTTSSSNSVTDNYDGSYIISYSPKISGTYNVTILINGELISQFPQLIFIAPGFPSPTTSYQLSYNTVEYSRLSNYGVVILSQSQSASTKSTIEHYTTLIHQTITNLVASPIDSYQHVRCNTYFLELHLLDANNNSANHLTTDTQAWLVGVENGIEKPRTFPLNFTIDFREYNQEGLFVATYKFFVGGKYHLYITLDGKNIMGSPFLVDVYDDGLSSCSIGVISVISAFIGIIGILLVVTLIMVFLFKAHWTINESNAMFNGFGIVGLLCLLLTSILFLVKASLGVCVVLYWSWMMGFSMVLSGVFSKQLDVYLDMKKGLFKPKRRYHAKTIKTKIVVRSFLLVFLPFLLMMSLYSIFDTFYPSQSELVVGLGDVYGYTLTCSPPAYFNTPFFLYMVQYNLCC
eukprot:TRINITY_DN447_c0_g2_i3.p1 TRINITY_DN447_c0_g2~~TRINITY_DN447_c0_g2_i3.p1  ORF type:complete len:1454 (-),score=303.72 TRINITY_DN447_c0_g2_i3:64-3873(-)